MVVVGRNTVFSSFQDEMTTSNSGGKEGGREGKRGEREREREREGERDSYLSWTAQSVNGKNISREAMLTLESCTTSDTTVSRVSN